MKVPLSYSRHLDDRRVLLRTAIVITMAWVAWSVAVLYLIWSGFFRHRAGGGTLRSLSLGIGAGTMIAVLMLWLFARYFSRLQVILMMVIILILEVALLITPIINY